MTHPTVPAQQVKVAEIFAQTKWEKTAIGKPETWPQSLRTAYNMISSSRFSMFIAWGASRTFLYNDAYAVILGRKHPDAFGESFQNIWKEIWPEIQPLVESVESGQSVYLENLRLLIDRAGAEEEAFFTFSYSPIRDDLAKVVGLFCTVVETTAQKRFQDALVKSEASLKQALVSARMGTWEINLKNQTIETSAATAMIHGIQEIKDNIFGVIEKLVHEQDRDGVNQAWTHAVETNSLYNHEYRIVTPAGEVRWIQASGQVYADDKGEKDIFAGVLVDVTDRILQQRDLQQAFTQLQQSEATTRSVLENALDAVVGMDDQGLITHWNSQAEKIFGYLRSEIIGRKMSETIVPSHHREAYENEMNRYFISGQGLVLNRRIEITAKRKDGTEFPVELSITPVKTADRTFFAAFIRDISSQKRLTRDILLKSDALEKSLNGFDIVNAKGEFIYANSAYLKMWGYKTLDEIIGTSPATHCADPNTATKIIAILKEHGECDLEFLAKRKDGSTFDVRMWARLAYDAEGKEVYPSTSIDITEHKHTEDLIKQSEEDFRTLANAMPQLCWMANPDGHIFWYNQGWYDYTGTTFEEMQGWGWEKVHNPELLAKTLPIWKKSLATGKPWEDTFQLKSKEGEFRWFLSKANPVRDKKGNIIRWLGSNTDVTDQKLFAERLEASQAALTYAFEEAQRASDAKSEFLANMSHEIRTPMNSILGFSELLLDSKISEDERTDFINKVRSNGKQLLLLIDDILDLSKVEAGKVRIDKVRFSITDLIQDVVESMTPMAAKKSIDIQTKFLNSVPRIIYSDPVRLKQILTNLIGNATKFSDGGKVDVRLEFIPGKKKPNEGCFEIDVEDSGIGISLEDQTKIFRPFGQADSSIARKFGGSGLGLVLSRRLAIALGGNVTLRSSTPGEGSCFRLVVDTGDISGTLLVRGTRKSGAVPAEAVYNNKGERRLHGLKILLAEDSKDNETLIRLYLLPEGAKLDVARDGIEAIKLAKAFKYDIILMDVQMPLLDGLEATRQLRASGMEMPILALTAHALREETEKSLNAGCNAHLTKPVSRKDLVEAILKYAKADSKSVRELRPRHQ